MNLVLLFVREDARVRALNHSFDMHLIYLGHVSCFSHPGFPEGAALRAAAVVDGLLDDSVSTLSSFRAHLWGWEYVWQL